MILVHQRYFARAGMEERVLATRLRADAVLAELGLPVGRTFVPALPDVRPKVADDNGATDHGSGSGQGGGGIPTVVWQCTYPDMAARREVERVLDASEKFTAVRREQSAQLERFTREYFELLE